MRQLLILGLYLAVILLPWTFEYQLQGGSRINIPLEPLLGLLAVAGVGQLFSGRAAIPKLNFPNIAVGGFVVAAALSIPFAELPVVATKAYLVLVSYAFVFYVLPQGLQFNKAHWQRLWMLYGASYLVFMGWVLINYFAIGIGYHHSYQMAQPFSPGHTLLVAMGFPLFIMALDRLFQRLYRWYLWLFVLLFIVLIITSYSRFYWALLPVVLFLFTFRYMPRLRIAMVVTAILLLISGISTYTYLDNKYDRERAWEDPEFHTTVFVQVQSIFVMVKNKSNTERFNRWKVAQEMFRKHPLTGVGLNVYAENYLQYAKELQLLDTKRQTDKMNAHQLYIGWLAEMGLLGVISGMLMLIAWSTRVTKLLGSRYAWAAGFILLNFLLLGIIEDYTLNTDIIPVFWLCFGFAAYLASGQKAKAE